MTDPAILRILDANANRAREAIRVLEDYARFALNDERLTGELKRLRHDFAETLKGLPMEQALLTRDTPHDVGTAIKTPTELTRADARDLVTANAKRLSEALRSMEEAAKTLDAAAAQGIERLRYRGYGIEQTLARAAGSADERFRRVRLYVLLTESLCHESIGGWERALDAILSGASDGAALCIQLREKLVSDAELFQRARVLVARCRRVGALSIINDRLDIAILAGADGVHLGQTDLPCAEARKIAPGLIIGISTENLEQARQGERDGATYIAVGPMFASTTKPKPNTPGPDYAGQALKEIRVPILPIGGITPANLPQLMQRGLTSAAVSSAVIAQPDPSRAVAEFLRMLKS